MDIRIMEATRLTREGRLAEATGLIQRTLRGGHAPPNVSVGRISSLEPLTPTGQVATPAGAGPAPSSEAPAPADTRTRPSSRAAVRRVLTGRPFVSPRMPPVDLGVPVLEGLLGRGSLLQPAKVDVAGPGQWIAGTHTCAAGIRDYKLYIPSGYHGQAVPLVVMLHGCTQTPDDFAAGTGMNGVAEAEGFLVAYPAQAPNANISKCWNWFEAAHQQREQGEPAPGDGPIQHRSRPGLCGGPVRGWGNGGHHGGDVPRPLCGRRRAFRFGPGLRTRTSHRHFKRCSKAALGDRRASVARPRGL